MLTPNDDNDFYVEIDADTYNQDFDDANPQVEEIEQEETDILFE